MLSAPLRPRPHFAPCVMLIVLLRTPSPVNKSKVGSSVGRDARAGGGREVLTVNARGRVLPPHQPK